MDVLLVVLVLLFIKILQGVKEVPLNLSNKKRVEIR